MNDPKYRLQAFGGLSAHLVEAARPVLVGQRKRLALLAALAADGNGGVSRDRLLAMFWPEADAAHARNALKQLVHSIRRELADDAIVDLNGQLTLARDVVSSDVREFRAAVEEGKLARAAELYRGPFLDGVYLRDAPEFERLVEETRRSLEMQYASSLEQLTTTATRDGDHASSIRWARTLARLDPLSTRSALVLIGALEASGDTAAAIKHGELHASLLRQELDVGMPGQVHEALQRLRDSHSVVAVRHENIEPVGAAPTTAMRRDANRDDRRSPAHAGRQRQLLVGSTAAAAFAVLLSMAWRARAPEYSPARPGALVQLTLGQTVETNPAISPDGKWVAFAASPPGELRAQTNSRIYVRRIDGGAAVPITSDSSGSEIEPRWSPDGARIAFRTGKGIFVVPALGGTPELLVPNPSPEPPFGVWLSLGDWSHDGSRITYADTVGVWVRDLVHGTSRLVAHTPGFGAHSPMWSPNDSMIVFVVGTGGINNVAPNTIWVVPASGGPSVRVTDGDHLNDSPVFATNGRSIFYVSNRDGARDIYQQRLPRRTGDSDVPTRLTTGANATSISLSADGRHLVYGAAILRSNVWSAQILSSAPTPASAIHAITQGTQEVECLTLSPDGAWLLYDSNRSGNQDIYKMPLSGGEPVRLTTDPADDFCPNLAPDGREIAFYSFRGTGRRRVFTMLADGSRQQPLLRTEMNEQHWGPNWSPDGHSIAFDAALTGARHVSIVSRLADSTWGARRDLVRFGIEQWRWSPDGRYASALSRDSGLVLLSPDGRLLRVLARRNASEIPVGAVWGRDPSTLFYRTNGPHNATSFWAISVDGGRPRLVLRLNDAWRTSRRAEFDTDGKQLFFTISTDDANIWKLELSQ